MEQLEGQDLAIHKILNGDNVFVTGSGGVGKYWGGYARGGDKRNYAQNALNSSLRKMKTWGCTMNITQQYITDLFIQAHAADRTHDHRKELEHAQSLQTLYNRQNGIGKQLKLYYPVDKVPTKGCKAKSLEDALNQMERFFGGK